MKRTTIGLDDDLFKELKARAAREGTTLGRLVNDLLRLATLRPPETKPYRFHLTTHDGGGPLPGVDFTDWNGIRDIMDGIKNPGDP